MRVFFTGFALAGVVCSPAPISWVQTAPAVSPDRHADPRLAKLRSFFSKASCPALEYSPVFLDAADRYKLDWRLLPSISFVESTCGKFARNNNFFGWNSGKAGFASPVEAIHEIGYRLSHSSLYRSKTLDGILAHYNQRADYAVKVKSVMRQIATGR